MGGQLGLAVARVRSSQQGIGGSERRRGTEEVAWVWTSLCAGIPKDQVEHGLAQWTGEACAQVGIIY